MTQMRNIGIRRFGSAHVKDKNIVFMVDYDDGSVGELSFPVDLIGNFIELINRKTFNCDVTLDLEVEDLGLLRDEEERLILKIKNRTVHPISCTLSQEQFEHLRDGIDKFDELPVARQSESN